MADDAARHISQAIARWLAALRDCNVVPNLDLFTRSAEA
jgi:hypothetical protein